MYFRHYLILPALALFLAACAGEPMRDPEPAQREAAPEQQSGEDLNGGGEPQESAPEARKPAEPVPPEVLYNVFAGEIAGQHEDYEVAARHYLDAALQSRDPELAERATQIALYAGVNDLARKAVTRLIEIAPDSRRAHRTAVALAVEEQDPVMARGHLERLIALAENEDDGWEDAAQLLARSAKPDFALDVIAVMVKASPDEPAAWHARSQLASHFDRLQDALDYADRAVELAPEDASLLAWRGRLRLSDADYAGAAKDLEEAVTRDPDDRRAMLNLAEALRRQGEYDQAQEILSRLRQDPELVKTRAALALEDEDWDLASELYGDLLDLPAFRQEARYFLGQLAELQERYDEALEWYGSVEGEQFRLDAVIRQAVVMAELERIDDALAVIAGLKSGNRESVEEAFLAEAQILSDAGRVEEAFAAYDEALNRLPDSRRLLYSRALLAAEEGRLETAETDLRSIIRENPEDALALNALGYTLADQTDRLEEAHDLIAKAYELSPDDAAIVDSMGWVHYRLGNHEEALEYLRRALDLQFDAEIAAHLGEVLWVTGDRDEARQVWEQALERLPEDSEIVRRTMERVTQ